MIRKSLAITAIAALAFVAPADAGSDRDRATGGGQILVSTRGAGDTIAFTAQNTGAGDAARGQVQYVDRTGGTGKGQVTEHGVVSCLVVAGNTAKLGGQFRDGSGFYMIVTDNGEGAAASNDVITIQRTDDVTCEREDGDDDGAVELARGNAQVYDAP